MDEFNQGQVLHQAWQGPRDHKNVLIVFESRRKQINRMMVNPVGMFFPFISTQS
jgi:hypothetical protein